ncbi:MAG TPA: hypothetical protein VFQ92_07330, partial [Blastocatellia bacterium]|nr:hypothetical protein [Blastocatellia bacterium]
SNRLQLSLPPMITALPRWSPDGKHIAFMARAPGRPWKINRVSPDGGAAEQLIAGGLDLEEGDPTWSPDGNRLAFGSNLFAEEVTSATKEIHLLDTKTGRISKLSGSDGMFAPRWSPDGRHIVAQSGDMKELLLFDFITSRWTVLTRAAVMDAVIIGWQHWSRDAKYIYFSSWGYDPAVFRIRVSDNKLERVATLIDLRILIGVFGGWIGFAPDDSPVVLRHTGSQEIYALEWIAP